MKNIFLSFLFLVIGLTSINAQMQLSIENQTASVGDIIDISVIADPNQTIDMLAFQFAIEWDENLLEYQSVNDFGFNSLDSEDFGQPIETGKNNMLLAVWEDYPNTARFNSQSTLFTIQFRVKPAFDNASSAAISFCNNCQTEFFNNILGNVTVNFQNGTVQKSALPIELMDFTATLNSADEVVLQWTTASEQNNSHFEIERSKNGVNWLNIGKKNSHGNSTKTQAYQFLDRKPLAGTMLYRLRQVDISGAATYSAIQSVTLTKDKPILTWNNPVTTVLNLEYTASTSTTLNLELFSGNGQLLRRQSFAIQEGANLLEWDISMLPSGIYWIKTNMLEFTAFKVIKQ